MSQFLIFIRFNHFSRINFFLRISYFFFILLKKADPGNIALHIALSKHNTSSTVILVIIGIIVGYLVYPPAIIICCLFSMLGTWFMPKIRIYLK